MLILVLRIHAIVLSSNYGLLWGSSPNGYQHGYCFNLRIENDKAKDVKILGIQSKVRKGRSIFYEFKIEEGTHFRVRRFGSRAHWGPLF
jgi:hypothetical protein